MSYRENNIKVSLVSYILVLGYFLIRILQMYQQDGLIASQVFRLWAFVIVATILLNIFGSILTSIVLSVVHAIKTQSEKSPNFVQDERDRLIELRGLRASYILFSIGVVIAMLSFVFGQPPLVMFSLIIFSSLLAEVIGNISQLYFYRRGF